MSGSELKEMLFPDYDEEIRTILPYYDSFHQETINLIEAVNLNPAIWLDTGCGTGTLVEMALKHFPITKFVMADPSAEMLEEARKKLCGSDRITFLKPNSTQDLTREIIGTPDVITAIQSHHYLHREHSIYLSLHLLSICFSFYAMSFN